MRRHESDRGKGKGRAQPHEQRPIALCVGVEIEAPLAVTKRNRETRERELLDGPPALEELARLFGRANLNAYADAVDDRRDSERWAVTMDTTISVGQELRGIGTPVEIKSRKMSTDSDRYKNEVIRMWQVIEPFKVPSIEYWKLASTHIHFSVKNEHRFPIRQARLLAFCIVYFERAIDDLLPEMTHRADRKRPGGWKLCERFARRNRVRPANNGRRPLVDLRSCWGAIRAAGDIQELSDLLCWDEDAYRRSRGMHLKYFKWNLKGLNYRTIEFRQMPPSRSAQETLDWIAFTTGFVAAATAVSSQALDSAMAGGISFAEAIGVGPGGVREAQLHAESRWASDDPSCGASCSALGYFVPVHGDLWDRIFYTRDKIQAELAMLNTN